MEWKNRQSNITGPIYLTSRWPNGIYAFGLYAHLGIVNAMVSLCCQLFVSMGPAMWGHASHVSCGWHMLFMECMVEFASWVFCLVLMK